MKKKSLIIFNLILFCFSTYAQELPEFEPIARNPEGEILFMSFRDAKNYCQNIGSRLPTIKELALWAQQLGAKGIVESKFKPKDWNSDELEKESSLMWEKGYRTCYSNIINEGEIFYYNYEGFKIDIKEEGDRWSSTPALPVSMGNESINVLNYDGDTGIVFPKQGPGGSWKFGVMCIKK